MCKSINKGNCHYEILRWEKTSRDWEVLFISTNKKYTTRVFNREQKMEKGKIFRLIKVTEIIEILD